MFVQPSLVGAASIHLKHEPSRSTAAKTRATADRWMESRDRRPFSWPDDSNRPPRQKWRNRRNRSERNPSVAEVNRSSGSVFSDLSKRSAKNRDSRAWPDATGTEAARGHLRPEESGR